MQASPVAESANGDPPRRLSPLLAGISAVLLIGLMFGASLWVLAALTATGLVTVNYYLALTWSSCTTAARNGADRELKIGSRLPVTVSVTNQSKIPVLWLLAEDLLPRERAAGNRTALQIIGDRLRVMLLWGQQSRRLQYEVVFSRRGYFQIGPTVLETGDLMGLYRRYRVTNQPQFITVLPNVVPLHTYEIGSRRPIGEIRMRDNVMEDPTRLRGIRHWQPGDPMRSIHWSATARTGELHTKVYEPSSIIGATLILDFHEDSNPAHHEPHRTDLAVTAAASITAMLHDQNEPVGLATNGRDAADRIRTEGWLGDHRVRGSATMAANRQSENDRLRPIVLPPDRGPRQLQEIHRRLARLERTDGLKLSELLIECESQLSAETTLLVIVQQANEAAIGALIGLAQRGRAVAVIVNTHDIHDYSAIAGPLIAQHITTHRLDSRQAIAEVCRQTLLR